MRSCRILRQRGVGALLSRSKAQVAAPIETQTNETLQDAKPYTEIPGPTQLPYLGALYKYFPGGEYNKIRTDPYKLFKYKFDQYGDIFREKLHPFYEFVALRNPAHFREAYRLTGKTPRRAIENFKYLVKLRQKHNKHIGLFLSNGEEWYRLRSQLQQEMMRPANIAAYIPAQELVADDFATRITKLRNQDGEVPDLLQELYKWAMESVGVVCFDARLGAMDPDLKSSPTADRFVQAVNDVFRAFSDLFFSLPLHRFYETANVKKLDRAIQVVWEISEKFMLESLERHKKGEEGLVKEKHNLLLTLLAKPDITFEEAVVFIYDLLAAAVDTTAHSMSFNLVQLTSHPEVQERLREEIWRVAPPGTKLTDKEMNQLKYLKAVVKETFRTMPTINGNSRVYEEDVVIGGYRIPAGIEVVLVNHVAAKMPEFVDNPESYQPERWIRGHQGSKAIDPEVLLPFGFGPRMCIGRRVAEQEIYLGLIKLMQNFRIEYHHPEPIEQRMEIINRPNRPLAFKFVSL